MKSINSLIFAAALLLLAACQQAENETATSEPKPAAAATASTESGEVADPAHPEQVWWGDEHVHTGWSGDAGMAGATLDPEEAVRFARGEEVESSTGEPAKLQRALDWVAVTDHSDGMGTINELKDGNPQMLADPTVKRWHDMLQESPAQAKKATRETINAQASKSLPKVMMDPKWTRSAWEKTVDIMEKYNEPGKFTTFIAYEWTSNGEIGQNLHRNVIFRDNADKTRSTPPLTTFVSAAPGRAGTDPESLWQWLTDWEAKTGGRVLAIPHNGDMSNGWMFRDVRYDGSPLTQEWVEARARWEPLVEVFQYKGSGEAHPQLSPTDEFADFEIWDTSDLAGNPKKPGEIEFEYARQALARGFAIQSSFGVNPFKFGMVSGSDTHTGLATTEEDNFWGKMVGNRPKPGRWDDVFKVEGPHIRKAWTLSAQGLTGVWATSNSRTALWDAMQRKEVYASSGPRITLRFFAGYDFTEADARGDLTAAGYARGVPMGGDLGSAPKGNSPTFLVAASKDPTGANLDRVQIVKGWADDAGKTHEKLFDVVWSDERKADKEGKLPSVGNTVDVASAEYSNSIGSGELIGVFTDPDFDPGQRSFYYARAIEIPTPRWTAYDAEKFGDKMDPEVTMVIQERAVSSPIWYEPPRQSVSEDTP